MAREDRERNFEKALARNLRPEPPADVQTHACPDAELLAAYHERSLPPEQMISWKEHIAGCPRCQEVLAHLEATDEIHLDANQGKYERYEVPVVSQPDLPVLTLAGARSSAPAALPASVAKSRERRRKLLRPANWRWLGPAGAIAAILILWVAFRENTLNRIEVAKNQPAPASTPAAPPAVRRSESPELKQEPNPESTQQETRSPLPTLSQPGAAPAAKNPAREENFNAILRETPAAPTDKTKADRERDQFAEKSLPLSGRHATAPQELSSGRFDAKKDAGELSKQGGAVGATASQAAPPPASRVAGAAASAPAPAASAADEAVPHVAKELTPPAVTESVEVTNQNETVIVEPQAQVVDGVSRSSTTAEMVRLARNQIPVTVNTPNQKVLWRIEAAGIVQRSTDSGSTWTLQKSGVVADLTAGSAPSEKVCWLVGRAGTILRTTDGGAHWLKVRSPVADDLSTVFAVDAQQATISAATNHKSYKTSDGGLTWTPVPSQ
jgi:hypothetical protein